MPGQKRKATSMVKKAAKRSRRKAARKQVVRNSNRLVRMGQGFPKRIVMTHKYDEIVTMSSTTTVGRYYWSCNSMYDPNATSTGHQPMYYDQLSTLYNHYVVIGSKCVIKFFPSGSLTNTILVGGVINDGTVAIASSTWNQIVEQSQAKRGYLLPGCDRPTTLTLKWSGRKQWGKGFSSDPNMRGTISSNPTEQQYFDFYCLAADGSSSVSVRAEVHITYICLWKELVDVSES